MQNLLQKAETFSEQKLKEYTAGLNFPATKAQIIERAKENKVPGPAVDQLDKLPDKTYQSLTDVAITAAKEVL